MMDLQQLRDDLRAAADAIDRIIHSVNGSALMPIDDVELPLPAQKFFQSKRRRRRRRTKAQRWATSQAMKKVWREKRRQEAKAN